MRAWSVELGIPYGVMRNRLKDGWDIDDIFQLSHREHFCCLQCGKEYERYHLTQKFCSSECREAYYKSQPKGKVTKEKETVVENYENCGRSLSVCQYCGKEYFPNRTTQKYCSKQCQSAAYKETHKEYFREQHKLYVQRKLQSGLHLVNKYVLIPTVHTNVPVIFQVKRVIFNKTYSDVPIDKNVRWVRHKSPCLVIEAENKHCGIVRVAASDCEILEVRKNA